MLLDVRTVDVDGALTPNREGIPDAYVLMRKAGLVKRSATLSGATPWATLQKRFGEGTTSREWNLDKGKGDSGRVNVPLIGYPLASNLVDPVEATAVFAAQFAGSVAMWVGNQWPQAERLHIFISQVLRNNDSATLAIFAGVAVKL